MRTIILFISMCLLPALLTGQTVKKAVQKGNSDIILDYNSGKWSEYSVLADTICQADFTWNYTSDSTHISFRDASAPGVISWYWDFGDGTTSILQQPNHNFEHEGTFTVTLSTKDATGLCTSSVSKHVIAGSPLCSASFDMLIDSLTRTVTFQDSSKGEMLKYYWSFGDGKISKLQNPVHQYKQAGFYEASLSIRNSAGNCSDKYAVRIQLAPPVCDASFSVFVESTTNTAYFNSKVQDPANKYYWIFGDGTISNISNPVVQFGYPGYYSAMLTVSNEESGCSDSWKKVLLIGSQGIDCESDFIYNVEEGNNVFFTDRSLGNISAWHWNFGDGQLSGEVDPSHTYSQPGFYNVCLTVYAENEIQNTRCQKILVSAEDAIDRCLAQFIYTVVDTTNTISCTDRSFGSPDSWKWEYQDGWTSTLQNPVYTAPSDGYYLVRQHIENSATGDKDDAFGLINVNAPMKLKGGYGYVMDESIIKAESYPVDYVGVSLGDASKYKWSFGDGTYDSTTTSPTHEYTAPGTYEVCLIIIEQVSGDSDTSCQMVTVSSSSVPDLTDKLSFRVYPNPFRNYTDIYYELDSHSLVDLAIYNLIGQKLIPVEYLEKPAGIYQVRIDGTNLGQGMYILRLKTNSGTSTSLLNLQK